GLTRFEKACLGEQAQTGGEVGGDHGGGSELADHGSLCGIYEAFTGVVQPTLERPELACVGLHGRPSRGLSPFHTVCMIRGWASAVGWMPSLWNSSWR